MPNLLNRSKQEEFESNSVLQIRNQKEIREEKAEKRASSQEGVKIWHHCAKISSCIFPFDPILTSFAIFPKLPLMK